MQRDSTARQPAATDTGTPAGDTPLGRLLRKQSAAPERPVDAPPRTQSATLEAPAAEPIVSQKPAREAVSAESAGRQDSVLRAAIGKLLRRKDVAPQAPVAEPPRPQGTALAPVSKPPVTSSPNQGSVLEKSSAKLLRLPRRTRDEREFLPAALEIVDTPPSPVGRAIGFTIIAVAVIAIAWACLGKVDIIATAAGRVVPQGKTKIVQPADTGIVTAIHVADGDHVKAGDVLIELNATQPLADRDRFARDLLQGRLNLARLRGLAAAMEGKQPILIDPPQNATPEDLALTESAMRAQVANESAKLADLDQQIAAKVAEAAEAEAAAEKLQASLPMLAEQEKLLRDLRDQKIGSKLEWYQANQALIEQQHEIVVLAHRKDAAKAAQSALRQQRGALAAEYQMSVLSELDKVRAQVSELQAELDKAAQRLSQGVLRAPIDGTVQQLAVHTIGGVVTPAEPLLALVPNDATLVVEAAVQNRDVGFIRAGQPVRVKLEAFNFTLYGLLEGRVLGVTRDVVDHSADDKTGKSREEGAGSNAEGGPVYLARIALSQDWMMTENGKVPLTPGMAVTAEIQTGERRLISYLLSPLSRHVSESMHER